MSYAETTNFPAAAQVRKCQDGRARAEGAERGVCRAQPGARVLRGGAECEIPVNGTLSVKDRASQLAWD